MTRNSTPSRAIAIAVVVPALLILACPGSDDAAEGSTAAEAEGGSAGSSGGDALGCAADVATMFDTTDGATDPLQGTWGAACSSDADCVALLGAGAVCLDLAVAYELPGGYCTKPCMLPDSTTTFVLDDPMCDPAGGIACIGQSAVMFQYCAPPCTDDQQCDRDGYMCRRMPQISQDGDPSFCLMPDCCGGTCANPDPVE
jgi:hypothetical protein